MIYHQPRPARDLTSTAPSRGWRLRYLLATVLFTLLGWSSFAPGAPYVHVSGHTGGSLVKPGWLYGTYSWEIEETSDTPICFHKVGCVIAICYYSTNHGQLSPCINPSMLSPRAYMRSGGSAKDARAAFIEANGISGEWRNWTYMQYTTACYTVMYWQGRTDANRTGLPVSASPCGTMPPTNDYCELGADVVIDYGSVAAAAVQGSSKSESLDVRCTTTTDITITLGGGVKSISLGGGITSKLSINDSDLSSGAKITAPEGSRSFPITSTLTSSGNPVAGSYSGSGIIVLGYQ